MKPAPTEQAVFDEALQHDTPEARAAYLDAACGTDTALRQRVEALLRAAESAGDFLEAPPAVLSGGVDTGGLASGVSEKPGDRIGQDAVEAHIGRGQGTGQFQYRLPSDLARSE